MKIESGKTAISRPDLSLPLRRLMYRGRLERERHNVFDYGHGRGDDMRQLAKRGFKVGGWDPNYNVPGFSHNWPMESEDHDYNFVYCGYVLNVLESTELREAVIADIYDFLPRANGEIAVAVRSFKEVVRSKTDGWESYGDGWVTSANTFQRGFRIGEVVDLLDDAGFQVMTTIMKEPILVWARI